MKKGTTQELAKQAYVAIINHLTASRDAARKTVKARTEAIRRRDITIRALRNDIADLTDSLQAKADQLCAADHHRHALQKRADWLSADLRNVEAHRDTLRGEIRRLTESTQRANGLAVVAAVLAGIGFGIAAWGLL